MNETTLGKILTGAEARDAIHVAILPIQAHHWLHPGQGIKPIEPGSTRYRAAGNDPTGIVDPFLPQPVQENQWCWMLLWPGKVTDLRHHWTCPEIDQFHADQAEGNPKIVAEAWLKSFADVHGLSYAAIIQAGLNYITDGDQLCEGGRFEGVTTPPEFWKHLATITEWKRAGEEDGNFFACHCA